ncbi:MAG TPA: putative zinc-binding protein [Candidatus Kapabacteria bacterium]|nr:putative zinc-binding protein [Candidatus Kapabacteria bacterium]
MAEAGYSDLPLVYSCSGCSSVAQLANRLALELDREQVAEMSCIAGVGGGVPALVKKALSGRRIIALDGCALRCVHSCLARVNVVANQHYLLTDYGLKKTFHADFAEDDVVRLKKIIVHNIASDDGVAERLSAV